jgi:hypothetical protein
LFYRGDDYEGDAVTEIRETARPVTSDIVDTLIVDLLEWMGSNPERAVRA